MWKLSYITTLVVALILTSGCTNGFSALKLYRVPVQQGNIVTQDMIDKIKPGMTKSQVAFVLGEPVLRNPFNESKWIYIYSIEVPGLFTQKTRTILFFDGNELKSISGDLAPSEGKDAETTDS